jgi:predicted phage terminase large subunit-like protein
MRFEMERQCRTSIGFVDPRSYEGELLDPVRMPRETLDSLEAGMTEYAVAGQNQQRPSPREGGIFKRYWFDFVAAVPAGAKRCRGWDLAASKEKAGTSKGPAFTAGVKLAENGGEYFIEHSARERGGPADVDRLVKATAISDGHSVLISIPQDPGQAAIGQKLAFSKLLAGFTFRFSPETGDKVQRANPVSSQAEVGNVKIVRTGDPAKDAWIEPFLEEITMFPSGTYKDQVDALSRAFAELLKPIAPAAVFGVYGQR